MRCSLSQFPDMQTLAIRLTEVAQDSAGSRGSVTVLSREPNKFASTFLSEIVTCRLGDGAVLQLFCKYEAGRFRDIFGHRGGVAYEVQVYRHVLQPLDLSAPEMYGAATSTGSGDTWLVIEFVDDAVLAKRPDLSTMGLIARWIGQFHAANEKRLSADPMPFLKRYDTPYYVGWARRTCAFARPLRQRYPWLASLCKRFEESVAPLLACPPTIIHGEYYPKNVLVRGKTVYPVDWESAAVAAGEIDLVSITAGCSDVEKTRCEAEYTRARWPDGVPPDLEHRLELARLYLNFRWLGDRPEWTTHARYQKRFKRLHTVAQRLGLL